MSTCYGSVASLTRTGPRSDFLQESPHRAGAAVRGGRPSLWRVRQFSFHVDGNTNICAHTHKHNIHAHTTQSSHAQHACTQHNIHVLHMQTHTYTTNICAHTHKQNIHVIDTHTAHTIHTHNTHMLHVQTHTHTTTPMHTRSHLLRGGEVPELCSPLVAESPCARNTHTLHMPMTCSPSGSCVLAEASSWRSVAGRKWRNWVPTWP